MKRNRIDIIEAIGSVVRSENRLPAPNMNLPVVINDRHLNMKFSKLDKEKEQ